MIRLHVTKILLGLCVLLCAGLGALWFDDKGLPKNVHWAAPTAVKPDFGQAPAASPASPASSEADVSHFVAILDRPLFSPSRRPPPPPPPPAPPPPPDPFATIQLLGVFAGTETTGSGIVARIDGKVRRVRINEMIGSWAVKAVNDRDVTFASGDETRVIKLIHLRAPKPPVPAVANAGANAGTNTPQGSAVSNMSAVQQRQDEGRERLRRRNEIRAKAGLPPLTE